MFNKSEKKKPYCPPGITVVRAHIRKNGVWVRPHIRTTPDGIKQNNLSFFK